MLLKLVLLLCLTLMVSLSLGNNVVQISKDNVKLGPTDGCNSGSSGSGGNSGETSGSGNTGRYPDTTTVNDGVTYKQLNDEKLKEFNHCYSSGGSGSGGNSGETSGSGNTGRYPDTTTVNDGVTYKASESFSKKSLTSSTTGPSSQTIYY